MIEKKSGVIADVKRYRILAPPLTPFTKDGAWLADVFVGDDGLLSIVSDYGNYVYWWHGFGDDFRAFLCGINTSYLLGKVSRQEYDGAATAAAVRERAKLLPSADRKRELALLKEHGDLDERDDFIRWHLRSKIEDAHTCCCAEHPAQALAFCERVWPLFVAMLKAEAG